MEFFQFQQCGLAIVALDVLLDAELIFLDGLLVVFFFAGRPELCGIDLGYPDVGARVVGSHLEEDFQCRLLLSDGQEAGSAQDVSFHGALRHAFQKVQRLFELLLAIGLLGGLEEVGIVSGEGGGARVACRSRPWRWLARGGTKPIEGDGGLDVECLLELL